MSNNFDLIATVDIDLTTPLVDGTSFDNMLIMGPAPKGEFSGPDVGVYSNIEEVKDAGFVVSGEGADPVGVAARIAFAQSPSPTAVYIAVQKKTAAAIIATQTIEDTNAYINEYLGAREDMTGCTIAFAEEERKVTLSLTGPVSGVKNTNMFVMLKAMQEQGYVVSVDGVELTDVNAAKALPVFEQIAAMTKGSDPVEFTAMVSMEGGNDVGYSWVVEYPDPKATAAANPGVTSLALAAEETKVGPSLEPDQELENVTDTIERALTTSGWYVLCTAGVDEALYEEIAAFIETQEKMFLYTDLQYLTTGVPLTGDVYFRTAGIYAREISDPDNPKYGEISEGNLYLNCAFAAKWLNYESGSETAAFKAMASVYPSKLKSAQVKALEAANMCYFIAVGNKNISMEGITRGGEWMDVIRFRDWQKNDMQLAVANAIITRSKLPYTDGGISVVQNQMQASLKRGQNAGGIAPEEFDEDGVSIPAYVVTVPRASSITASQKASRKLYNCKFKARLAGAIHFAELKGSLTYAL